MCLVSVACLLTSFYVGTILFRWWWWADFFIFHREQGRLKLVLFKLKGPVLSFTMFFFYMLWFHEITSQPTAFNWAEGMKSDILTMEMYQGVLNTEGKFVFGYNGYIPLNISCAAFSFVFGFICFCISMDRLRGLEIFDEQKKSTQASY